MSIKRLIIAVVVFIIPVMLGFGIVKGTFSENNDARFSVSALYDYVLTFPTDHIDDIRYELGEVRNVGFEKADLFEPDWSGTFFEDIAEIGRMIADFFVAIWDYISFCIKLCYLTVLIVGDGLIWILGFPTYLITNA